MGRILCWLFGHRMTHLIVEEGVARWECSRSGCRRVVYGGGPCAPSFPCDD